MGDWTWKMAFFGTRKLKSFRKGFRIYSGLRSQVATSLIVQQKHSLCRVSCPLFRLRLWAENNYLLVGVFCANWFRIIMSHREQKNSRLGKILSYVKVDLVSNSFKHHALIACIVITTGNQSARSGQIFRHHNADDNQPIQKPQPI